MDILVTAGGRQIAIEVETGKSDWRANAKKCLAAGLDHVILAGTRARVCRVVDRDLPTKLQQKVRVRPAWEVSQVSLDKASQQDGSKSI